jgi:hypothetical protein
MRRDREDKLDLAEIFEVNLSLLISLRKIFLSQKEGAGLAFGGPGSDFIACVARASAERHNRR